MQADEDPSAGKSALPLSAKDALAQLAFVYPAL